jgi:hypothetical protein
MFNGHFQHNRKSVEPDAAEITPIYPMTREWRVDAQNRVAREIGIGRHGGLV